MGSQAGRPCADHLIPWMDAGVGRPAQEDRLCRSGLPTVRADTARRVLTDTGQGVGDQANYCGDSLGTGRAGGSPQVRGAEPRSRDSRRAVGRAAGARGLCTCVVAVPCWAACRQDPGRRQAGLRADSRCRALDQATPLLLPTWSVRCLLSRGWPDVLAVAAATQPGT